MSVPSVRPHVAAPILFAVLLLAASPPTEDDLIRTANAAFLRSEYESAARFYEEAEERTGDPGLVAFNRAAVQFQRGEFADAERLYARVLDDRDCPRDRAINAWFNRGACLLRRGGDARVYHSAIACFERCLDLKPSDAKFRTDAEYNLELAKVLWIKANADSPRPLRPNDLPPEPPPEPPPLQSPGKEDPGDGSDPNQKQGNRGGPKPVPQQVLGQQPNAQPMGTDAKTPGNNAQLPVVRGGLDADPTDPESARELLKQADVRLQKRREQMNAILGGSVRSGVRDW